jgi:RNA polymerase sigma factor (TIGR02999 family)
MTEDPSLTLLLGRMQNGDREAEAQVLEAVFGQLRALARRRLARERAGHTLEPTELVHEAYMKLIGQKAPWQNRAQFFGVAAGVMRRLLVDHARARTSMKRGGTAVRVEMEEGPPILGMKAEELIAVDEALERLEAMDERQARIVQMKFFAGMNEEEIGEVIGVTPRTVRREWEKARLWLFVQLGDGSREAMS